MSTLQLAIVCGTVLLLAALAASAGRFPFRARAAQPGLPPVNSRGVAHLIDGTSLTGKVAENARELVLVEVEVVSGGGTQPVGGVIRLVPDRISWTQEL